MNYSEFILPLLLLVACGAHFLSRKQFRRRAGQVLSLSLVGMFLISWPPVAWLVSGSLEWWYETNPAGSADAETIVVLAGAAWPAGQYQPYDLPRNSTVVRCRHAAFLHARWKSLPVIVCGAKFSREGSEGSVSDLMATLLRGWNVPEHMLRTDDRSRSTFEQAVRTAEMLRESGSKKILLVTEAYHMLRAAACFRRAGLEVTPAPCGFRAASFEFKLSNFLPNHDAIRLNEEALHEWSAIAWYWVRGRI
jgi:uncharacterized SAM-binding protein YcdF (DUF218 family)